MIPEFQREYVWLPVKAVKRIDSLYRGVYEGVKVERLTRADSVFSYPAAALTGLFPIPGSLGNMRPPRTTPTHPRSGGVARLLGRTEHSVESSSASCACSGGRPLNITDPPDFHRLSSTELA